MKYKILIIDEEESFVKQLKTKFEENDWEVTILDYDSNILKDIAMNIYSMIILDMWSSGFEGNMLIKKIRDIYSIPIIILSGNSDRDKIIKALDLGADEYILKSTNMDEIAARIRALLRRSYDFAVNRSEKIKIGNMLIDTASRKVSINGKFVDLTSKEYDILYLLVTNNGKVYDRETLLQLIWGYDYYGDSRTVDVHVRRLREKIEKDPSNPQYVLTKWGIGYYYKG